MDGTADIDCESVGFQSILSVSECMNAAIILGGTDSDNAITSGSWSWVPIGCTMQKGTATPQTGLTGAVNVHFSTTWKRWVYIDL